MNAVEVARFMFQKDGMRRVTGNRSGDRRPSRLASVQRVLFPDAVDHEETREFLRRETERISLEFRERWNFDFETQTPLHGRYEWERLTTGTHPANELSSVESRLAPQESNPEASVSSTTTTAPSTRTVSSTTVSSSADKGPCESQERDHVPPTLPKTTTASGSSSIPVQRKLTEFMAKRKRSAPSPVKSTDASSTPKNKVRKTTAT